MNKPVRDSSVLGGLPSRSGKTATVFLALLAALFFSHFLLRCSAVARCSGAATANNGELVMLFTPYQMRTFAVTLAAAVVKVAEPQSRPVTLLYDRSAR